MTQWLRAALAAQPDLTVTSGCAVTGEPGASVFLGGLDRRPALDAALAAHGCVLNPIDPVSRLAKDVCTIHVNDIAYSLTRRADPQGTTLVSITRL
jgi:hypothetical protein